VQLTPTTIACGLCCAVHRNKVKAMCTAIKPGAPTCARLRQVLAERLVPVATLAALVDTGGLGYASTRTAHTHHVVEASHRCATRSDIAVLVCHCHGTPCTTTSSGPGWFDRLPYMYRSPCIMCVRLYLICLTLTVVRVWMWMWMAGISGCWIS
jgi:hypothetical protein